MLFQLSAISWFVFHWVYIVVNDFARLLCFDISIIIQPFFLNISLLKTLSLFWAAAIQFDVIPSRSSVHRVGCLRRGRLRLSPFQKFIRPSGISHSEHLHLCNTHCYILSTRSSHYLLVSDMDLPILQSVFLVVFGQRFLLTFMFQPHKLGLIEHTGCLCQSEFHDRR